MYDFCKKNVKKAFFIIHIYFVLLVVVVEMYSTLLEELTLLALLARLRLVDLTGL